MKVTISFKGIKIVVPCGDGDISVQDCTQLASTRYKKAIGKHGNSNYWINVSSLKSLDGGILDPDDLIGDVCDDREQLQALYEEQQQGDGNSSDSSECTKDDIYRGSSDSEPLSSINSHGRQLSLESGPDSCSLHVLRRKEPLGASANKPLEKTTRGFVEPFPELLSVLIPNEIGPLGIHVVPCDVDGCLVVQGIEPGGRVDRNGRLAVGDEIIEINGISLSSLSFSSAQELFKNALLSQDLNLKVVKGGRENNKENLGDKKTQNVLPGTKVTSAVQSNNTRKIGRVHQISLTKGSEGLGFSITARDNSTGNSTPMYIKNVLSKGAAIANGNLKPGDRLLQVNGVDVSGMSQSDVVSRLRSLPLNSKIDLLVSRHESFSYTHSEVDSGPLCQTIQREILTFDIPVHDTERAGLGVSVKGKTSTTPGEDGGVLDLGIFVKSVLHGGAASRDGRLKNNDQLININGLSLLGKPNPAAMETLRKAMHEEGPLPGIISLTVSRNLEEFIHNTPRRRDSLSSLLTSSSSDEVLRDYSVNFKVPTGARNPVLDRLMGTGAPTNLRNESYIIATEQTTFATNSPEDDSVVPFTRDQPGRQSMSEKRHATLDAKNTDTYQKRKKARELAAAAASAGTTRTTGKGITWKKSASLESLRCIGDFLETPEEETSYTRASSVRVSRNRGINESFRAAVDRSYDKEKSPDYEIQEIQSSLESQGIFGETGIEFQKKRKFLKNLGTMFKCKNTTGSSSSSSSLVTKSDRKSHKSGGNGGSLLSNSDGVYESLVPLGAMTRPGSRVAIADPTPSHYDVIQRHLSKGRSKTSNSSRRPKSNFYDYESWNYFPSEAFSKGIMYPSQKS